MATPIFTWICKFWREEWYIKTNMKTIIKQIIIFSISLAPGWWPPSVGNFPREEHNLSLSRLFLKMQSCFCRNIWQSITESRICCVTYLLTLFELPSLKDLLSSSDYANPSVWHPGWIFCPPLSLFNNSNEKNYKTGNWIAALTRRFSFGEKGWWTQHSSVWPEKYRKPRTEILKLNTKHLKQKSENRNRTFQMRTAQLVGWTVSWLAIHSCS